MLIFILSKVRKFCKLWKIHFFLLLIFSICRCASVGDGPSGGNYDRESPKFMKSIPPNNTIHFDKKRITLFFDKNIFLKNPFENVIISPLQKKYPSIKSIGKKIIIELKDTLYKNMTYTFDFNNVIVDYNEGNTLKDFNFAFSTGNVVDSLIISGYVLNAENLKPSPYITVGIYSNLSDTAFMNTPFLRVSRTDENGHFQIKNLAPGIYRIFALEDNMNKNFKLDFSKKTIAFGDTLIGLSYYHADNKKNMIKKNDSIIDRNDKINHNYFIHNNILLRLFKSNFEFQYLKKKERINKKQLLMNFSSSIDCLPKVRLLNETPINFNWYITELTPDKKTLIYWIKDSALYLKDTLVLESTYLAHDSLHKIVFVTDTTQLISKEKNTSKIKEQKFLKININLIGKTEVFDTLKIVFSEPVLFFQKKWLHIWKKSNTLWKMQNFSIMRDSLNPRIYLINYQWDYNQDYRILIDSASVFSIYNKWNNYFQTAFKIKMKEEYGNLCIQIKGIKNNIGFGQLVDSNEKILKEASLINNKLFFDNIIPGKYYLRYIKDKNGNGIWDTGNYAYKQQPEQIYCYPYMFEIKKNMQWQQVWDIKE